MSESEKATLRLWSIVEGGRWWNLSLHHTITRHTTIVTTGHYPYLSSCPPRILSSHSSLFTFFCWWLAVAIHHRPIMANTSRKRPPPAPTAAANGARNGEPPSTAVVGGISGIDALLAKYARSLPPGASVTVKLVKGPSSSSVDPIAARRAAAKAARAQAAAGLASSGASSGNDSDGGGAAAAGRGIAAPLSFPRMAKFGESVTPPDFFAGSLKDGRMYEEEVPKAKVRL